jgi:tetratricopeptide (TPR) repeat protein
MARVIITGALIGLLSTVVGCSRVDSGQAQLLPPPAAAISGAVKAAPPAEVDIIEQLAVNRRAYRQSLQSLVQYYTKAGDNMKLTWAEKELAALDSMPKYNYIVEASVAGARLKASSPVVLADALYNEAVRIENEAGKLVVVKDDGMLRLALDKFNQLIRDYPTSDKIDDAAFHAAGIYEHFSDYTIAALYYQRVYEWDPETTYPAKFKAAYVLDTYLHRRGEALELYKQAVASIQRAGQHPQWRQFAENRIAQLTKTGENVE